MVNFSILIPPLQHNDVIPDLWQSSAADSYWSLANSQFSTWLRPSLCPSVSRISFSNGWSKIYNNKFLSHRTPMVVMSALLVKPALLSVICTTKLFLPSSVISMKLVASRPMMHHPSFLFFIPSPLDLIMLTDEWRTLQMKIRVSSNTSCSWLYLSASLPFVYDCNSKSQ